MNHADTAYALIHSCRTFTGWSAGLSLFSELRRRTGLRLPRLRRWAGLRRPGLSAAQYIRQSILEPSAFISPAWSYEGGPTPGMPQLSVSRRDADALVAYLLAR